MIFYRFLPAVFAVQALQSGVWKLGLLSRLNDPQDGVPAIRSADSGRASIDLKHLTDLYDEVGILSYSSVKDDPVIWTHYADGHRGIALGFDFGDHYPPLEVRYPEENLRPVLDEKLLKSYDHSGGDQIMDARIQKALLTKARSWSYEREYRHLIRLSATEAVGEHFFRGIPYEHLVEVVLGIHCRFTGGQIRLMLEQARSRRKAKELSWIDGSEADDALASARILRAVVSEESLLLSFRSEGR